MGRPLQTIYKYFYDYSEAEIDNVIKNLPLEDRIIIRDRYGYDLHRPSTLKTWNEEKQKIFYKSILPKIKNILKNQSINKIDNPIFIEPLGLPLKVIELIKKGKNNNEICTELNIDINQLSSILLNLKNSGLTFSRHYYSNGTIKYQTINDHLNMIDINTYNREKTIITDVNEDKIKLLVMADLHFGNSLERLDLIDRAYNYCINNKINTILCCGDLIDGSYTKGSQSISDIYHQIEHFIKDYPYDKNILTFCVGGDHDLCALHKRSLNMVEILQNYRHDVIMCGYNNVGIIIKNDSIDLYHQIYDHKLYRELKAPIAFHGHAHKFITDCSNKLLFVSVPSISNIMQPIPSVLEVTLSFNRGFISDCTIKNICFDPKEIVLSSSSYKLSRNIDKSITIVKNVEDYKKYTLIEDVKTLSNKMN
ncbi:MAG: metallophosphoesterase family protein [Bacilli bacterium]|nr:metallophosphoesterase family protein [Bacilli bacterium]